MIILLDGSKGAGKSSVSEILTKHLDKSVPLSLDNERRALKNQKRNRTELNREAFENIINKAKGSLGEGRNVIIDCGLTKERVSILEHLASDTKSKLHKFFLKASYNTLLNRVRFRDKTKGKNTDIERFDEVFKIIHSKELGDFNVIETEKLSPEGVANAILRMVNK
ncbi:MAG: AAA family ATPase [Minisyncoccia bacterium]|jgi:predicted kinase